MFLFPIGPSSTKRKISYQIALHFATRREPHLAGSCRMARIALPPAELAAAIVLQTQRTIVIIEACKLFSRPRVAATVLTYAHTPTGQFPSQSPSGLSTHV